MSKKLFIPGPIDVSQDVLNCMATQVIGHRSEESSKLQEEISLKLQKVLYTKNTILLSILCRVFYILLKFNFHHSS